MYSTNSLYVQLYIQEVKKFFEYLMSNIFIVIERLVTNYLALQDWIIYTKNVILIFVLNLFIMWTSYNTNPFTLNVNLYSNTATGFW